MRHQLTAGILILALVAQFGCASSGSGKRSTLGLLPPPPGDAVKVAVTSGRFSPTFNIIDLNLPWSLKMQLLVAALSPLFIPGLVLAPFIVEIGDALRDKEAGIERGKRIAERKATVREMVAAQKIQDDLRDRVVAIGLAKTPHTFTGVADRGPSAPGEQPDYRALSQEGVQTVLEVVVESVTLDGIFDIPDPEFRLVMTVNTRLVRTVDNLEIHAKRLTYRGERMHTLAEWVDDAGGFRYELYKAYTDFAVNIMKDIEFLRTGSN